METESNEKAVVENTQSFAQSKHFFQKLSSSNLNADVSGSSPPKPKPTVLPKPSSSPIQCIKAKSNSFSSLRSLQPKSSLLPKQVSLPERSNIELNGNHVENNHVTVPNEVVNNEFSKKGSDDNRECTKQNELVQNEASNSNNEHKADECGKDEEEDDGWGSEFDSGDSDNEQPIINKRESMIIFQGLEGMPELDFVDNKEKKLYNIAKEILTTEITYVQTLKLLDQEFYFRLDQECRAHGIIPTEVLLEIFSNVTTIHQFHRDFLLPKLQERMKAWKENPKVGDIFNFLAPFLKMYAEYVKNFDQAMNSLAKWKQKAPRLAAIINEIQKTKECNNLTLEHHMLTPIQRVPRYKLLLKDYISKLPEDSPDLLESKKALEIITSAANHANESMKKMERFQKMLHIQEKFGDGTSIVTPSREFIMEGELVKISQRNAQPMSRVIVLFNDAIYYCSKVAATGKYKVHRTAELLFAHVEEAEEEMANRELMFRVRSKRQVTDFLTTSIEEKEKWVTTLKEAIVNVVNKNSTFGRALLAENELGKIAPLWVKDTDVSMCMECSFEFTTLKRRHHCRACGRIVCSGCSSFKASLEYDHNKINRVCMNCHKILTKGESDVKEKQKKPGRRSVKRSVCADVLINGYFNFRSEHAKTWVKRWCTLGVDFTIYVFKAKKDAKTQATIPLPGFTVEDETTLDAAEKTGSHVFKVSHQAFGWFMFEADNEETLKRWVEYISYAVKAETPPTEST